jgi:enoyl-CoA hydratase
VAYETILVDEQGAVGRIRLNRPQALNALSAKLLEELGRALDAFDANARIHCAVLLGGEKAFAAGADIKEMQAKSFADVITQDFGSSTEIVTRFKKPLIAGVAGFALGGGCELAMACDIIIAADTARFGQPEITLGVIPGWGGSQRLPRAVGKAKAMELVLAGRMMSADEAERAGLVSRVVPLAELEAEVMKVAERLTSLSLPALVFAKEAVNRAFESPLAEGLRFERRAFHVLFATEDRAEGMAAFVEKRPPRFKNR